MADKLPPVTFTSFVISLASTAMHHLGEGGGTVDLPLARQSIDALAMLEDKTRGNLDDEEARLLRTLLHELRLKALEVGRRQAD